MVVWEHQLDISQFSTGLCQQLAQETTCRKRIRDNPRRLPRAFADIILERLDKSQQNKQP